MEPQRKYRIVAGDEEDGRDSTYIHNLEQLVMEQTIVISELKKDVAQINTAIEEIKKMLTEPKSGNLDKNTYNSFPIANKKDLEKVDALLAKPENRASITAYIRQLKSPGDTDFNVPLQNIFTDEFINNYNAKGTHGKEDVSTLLIYQVLRDAWTNEYVGIKEFQKSIIRCLHMGRSRYAKRINGNDSNSSF